MPKEYIKKKLQLTHSSDLLQNWYDPLILEFDSETNILQVRFPHAYFETWFQQQGQSAFEQAFSEWKNSQMPLAQLRYYRFGPTAPQHFTQLGELLQPNTHKNENFASFITNSKNTFPLAAAREVANPLSARVYNPFLLCGKNSTGKTHILRAIVAERTHHAAQTNHSNGQTAKPEALFFGDVDSLEDLLLHHDIATLRTQYSCFVVDDMQRMAHRNELQENLVKFMDACTDISTPLPIHTVQMIFACTGTLSSMEGLHEALRSRLEVGLVVELKGADLDVRMRFAQKRCAEYGIKVDKNQILLLAQRCTTVRQLSGIILKIQAFHDLVQRDITVADLENILRNTGDERQTLPADIVSTVAQYTGHKVEDILGSKRTPKLVLARQTAMYVCRELLGTSYPVLGKVFGGKDHSTVIHSIKKIKKLLVSNKDTQNMVTELKQRCQGR